MKMSCPLCDATAETARKSGDWARYDCPTCGSFEISGSEEEVVRLNEDVRQAHRERIAKERSRGIALPRVGEINKQKS